MATDRPHQHDATATPHDKVATQPSQSAVHPKLAPILARHGSNVPAIAAELLDQGLENSPEVLADLTRMLGNDAAMKILAALKPAAPTTPQAPTASPALSNTVTMPAAEPKASAADKQAVLPVPSPGGKPQARPAPDVAFDAVAATIEGLGFPAKARRLAVVEHHSPAMTAQGIQYKTSAVDKAGTTPGKDHTDSFAAGIQKEIALGAQAAADPDNPSGGQIVLHPAADPTTIIHETVHLFQQGQIGTYLYEPMTEILSALAFERLVKEGSTSGTYGYAADYLPWVVFVKEVLAPKLGWSRLFGYYVGQGIKNFGELCAELGFNPNAAAMKVLKEALTSTANRVDLIPEIRASILAGPAAPADVPKAFHKKGGALESKDVDTSSAVEWEKAFDARIALDHHAGETPAQTVTRLREENKRDVIQQTIARARTYRKEAEVQHPGLLVEIDEVIAMYTAALG